MKLNSFAVVVVSVLALGSVSKAEEVFRIEVGRDYNHYTQRDLQRRVWELERAVAQLQARVFQLEYSRVAAPAPKPVDTWICKVAAMGVTYSGTGATKAVAEQAAIEDCKAKAEDFLCKDAKCSQ